MNANLITNESLRSLDFAAEKRQAALRKISAAKPFKNAEVAPGISAKGIWMTDISAGDRRSYKAWRAGRGDFRVAIWKWRQVFGGAISRLRKLRSAGVKENLDCTSSLEHQVA